MTHSIGKHAILISALGGFFGSAHAQQPPDVVVSDANGNTAMGTDALLGTNGLTFDNTAAGIAALFSGGGSMAGGGNTAMGSHALYSCTTCGSNSAVGDYALYSNVTGGGNTAIGGLALTSNTGGNNTASGNFALRYNTTGSYNTASGADALFSNTTGNNNAAAGLNALACNTTGSFNTATGPSALSGGTFLEEGVPNPSCAVGYATGDGNTASGAQALTNNTGGNKNTASGYLALYSNTTGSYNTATGYQAFYYNTDGIRNTASGDWSLYSNTHGNDNTADGHDALHSNTVGSNNIGLGANSGYNVISGSYNIEIGNTGAGTDNGTIRIGTSGRHSATYIAGIENAKVTGSAVYVTSSGQLGVLASSERYKTEIAPMGVTTEKLQQLRPVRFHLKSDPNGVVQYGLVAEEVARVYPELVIRDESGQIEGVRYDELAPMLLNEVQLLRQQMAELRQINESMQAAIVKLQGKDQRVAMR